MTLLLVPITAPTFDDALADVRRALAAGADGIELRLDCMIEVSDEQAVRLCAEVPEERAILLTIRGRAEGGDFDGDEMQRVSRLIALGPQVQWIDCEQAAWSSSANIRQKIMLAVRRARHVEADGPEEMIDHPGRRMLVLSRHYPTGRPATLTADLLAMVNEAAADIVKIAWLGRTIRDNFEAFDLLRETPRAMIVAVMGEAGLMSRVLAKKFGAAAAFASLEASRASAPGQVTIGEMKGLYRWDVIGARTEVYGVVGDPVAHSLSPAVHNAAFGAAGRDAVYLPLRVAAGYESFKAFMVEALARPWMDLRGLSITAPHKEHAMRFVLERGGEVDELARRAGAVNTIRVDADGGLAATNTDLAAVIGALDVDLRGKRVAVLGAGGAARGCVCGLVEAGAVVTTYARGAESRAALTREFGCSAEGWEARNAHDAEIVVNATPMGQTPREDETPMGAGSLRAGMTVFDMVYRPRPTRLLREAAASGCRVVDGMEMFLRQAAGQFRYWTGTEAPSDVMREAAMMNLENWGVR